MTFGERGDETNAQAAVEEPPRVERMPPRASDTVLVALTGAGAIIVTLIATAVLLARDESSSWGWWASIGASGALALTALGLAGVLGSRRRAFLGETRLLLVKLDEAAWMDVRQPDLEQEAIDRRDTLIMSGEAALAERLTDALRHAAAAGSGAARPGRRRSAPERGDRG